MNGYVAPHCQPFAIDGVDVVRGLWRVLWQPGCHTGRSAPCANTLCPQGSVTFDFPRCCRKSAAENLPLGQYARSLVEPPKSRLYRRGVEEYTFSHCGCPPSRPGGSRCGCRSPKSLKPQAADHRPNRRSKAVGQTPPFGGARRRDGAAESIRRVPLVEPFFGAGLGFGRRIAVRSFWFA
jgi:hypothetical protein